MLYHTSQAVRCPKHDGGEEKADDENNGFHRRKCFYFIFIFRDVKRNYCFSLHVGWIGCRMDRLPAALVVWMPVLPDAGPAYFLLLSGEGSVAGLACSMSMDGWEAETDRCPHGTMSV